MNCANHPDRQSVAFCQSCGKPLCSECSRIVGNAVFCEPCLAARLAVAEAATSSNGIPFTNIPENASAPIPIPMPNAPNPALAALLGIIPGVGAMYNGQYAKGIVHLVVFAVLVSLSESYGIFGLFIAGWIFYQIFEAHSTARARRDGTPLPNPFGLNDIGEKLGFGKSWPGAGTAYPASANIPNQQASTSPGPGTSIPNWNTPPPPNYGHAATPIPPVAPYEAPFPAGNPLPPVDRNRFPAGAVLLILLGLLFFLGSTGLFHHFPIQRIFPFVLIATAVWIFTHKMAESGTGINGTEPADYRLRIFRALRGSIWVFLIGVLFFLDTFNILFWAHSWPLFIILFGIMKLVERSTSFFAPAAPYVPAGPAVPYPPPADSVSPNVSTSPHDEEER